MPSPRCKILCLLVLPALAAASGCYQKTVSASGFGADRMKIQPDPHEDRVMGYPKSTNKELRTNR